MKNFIRKLTCSASLRLWSFLEHFFRVSIYNKSFRENFTWISIVHIWPVNPLRAARPKKIHSRSFHIIFSIRALYHGGGERVTVCKSVFFPLCIFLAAPSRFEQFRGEIWPLEGKRSPFLFYSFALMTCVTIRKRDRSRFQFGSLKYDCGVVNEFW